MMDLSRTANDCRSVLGLTAELGLKIKHGGPKPFRLKERHARLTGHIFDSSSLGLRRTVEVFTHAKTVPTISVENPRETTAEPQRSL